MCTLFSLFRLCTFANAVDSDVNQYDPLTQMFPAQVTKMLWVNFAQTFIQSDARLLFASNTKDKHVFGQRISLTEHMNTIIMGFQAPITKQYELFYDFAYCVVQIDHQLNHIHTRCKFVKYKKKSAHTRYRLRFCLQQRPPVPHAASRQSIRASNDQGGLWFQN